MTFRKCAAAVWFVLALFATCAHATVAETAPSVIRGPVEYPSSAVSAGEEGTVQVVTEVGIDGRAGDAKIYQSSGYRDLDAAALRSIGGWSFTPGTKDGKPMAQEVIVPVRFKLVHDAARVSPLLEASAIASIVLLILGSLILVVGVVWSWVLGKRESNLWLWGMVPLWILTYPVFVTTHWSVAKRNLAVVLLGFAIALAGAFLALLGRAGT
jgi:protein TonB